jgi:hypothetical protein
MKRSITQNMLKRLAAQANEADIYGHVRIADNITTQVGKYVTAAAVREDEEKYTYEKEELIDDVRDLIWDAATRIFDYFGELPDARDIDLIVEDMADNLVSSLENLVHTEGVGKYEPETPGEEHEEEGEGDKEGVEVHWEISLPSDITDEETVEEEQDGDEQEDEPESMVEDIVEDIDDKDEPKGEYTGEYDGNEYKGDPKKGNKGDDLGPKALKEDRLGDNDPESYGPVKTVR